MRVVEVTSLPDVLTAIADIIEYRNFDLPQEVEGENRIVQRGVAFETYCKDRLVGLPRDADSAARASSYKRYLIYQGLSSHPPDAMYRLQGDAFEFKKRGGLPSYVMPLNSSFPKSVLSSSSSMLSKECRECEPWNERALFYVNGGINKGSKTIDWIWIADASLMAAPSHHYEKVAKAVRDGISKIPRVKFSATKELGRANNVDPLGVSSLRIRGMWSLDAPGKFFSSITGVSHSKEAPTLHAIMRESKWNAFEHSSRNRIVGLNGTTGFSFSKVAVTDPGADDESIEAILIRYQLPHSTMAADFVSSPDIAVGSSLGLY